MMIGGTIKFVLLCLAAGIGLAVVGIGVEDFWLEAADHATEGGEWLADNDELLMEYGERAIPYVLAGAGVVAPIYILRFVWKRMRKTV